MKRHQCCICHSTFQAKRSDAITCSTKCRMKLLRLKDKCNSELPDKSYNIIYADPPWHFTTRSKKGEVKCPQSKYATIGVEGLKRLPFNRLAATDCWLFMWVYGPLADEASDVARAWGFDISSKEGFVWRKVTKDGQGVVFGTGYTTRKNCETMLIAKKGKPKVYDHGISQVQDHPRLQHGEKPALFRELIVRLAGDLPRIELFSRHQINGWDAWGNQVGLLDIKGPEPC